MIRFFCGFFACLVVVCGITFQKPLLMTVAESTYTPSFVLTVLADSQADEIRARVLANPNLDPSVMYTHEPEPFAHLLVMGLASNPNAPSILLEDLLGSANWWKPTGSQPEVTLEIETIEANLLRRGIQT
ncbi:MAG TPA: hypothetical protein VN701_00305 [Candidatus Paceibacterota bacterium]|nr:hypothetical protein [Candidatus Paceibacterota bacterium]